MGVAALGRGAQGSPQDRDPDDGQHQLEYQPRDVQGLRATPGDHAGNHQGIDDPAGKDGKRAEQAGDQRRADIGRRVLPGVRQPPRQAPPRQAELQSCVHTVTSIAITRIK
ncbi:hypothetical protein G6F22_019282 [Rhizopus arrhizus]|uniref:Uncharacterized protein n=1 Tax=Rhizopus oryzae TaxID=64495 RepID=A0A9P6WSM4_RHIOR|nr:hypothetical protein G6F22_019282 [Rhizopus arrhizus]KAG1274430.1 hypothetical protein G6F64_015134 [Rhizopus arrhizus]KAG1388466.1 hypothetical protein G6F59_015943 [Rhizopus arrhizus]